MHDASRGCVRLRTLRVRSLALLALFIGFSEQQKDPVNNFCRRFGQQTAIVDNKLFIDGGILNWDPIPSFPNNYTNTWLSYQDLTTVAGSGMPQLHANLSKNASIPSVHGGALWADDVNKRLYLFGGEYLQDPPSPFSLFAYDVIHDYWDNLGAPTSENIQGVSYGAGVSVSERGEAYYYGGWLGNASRSGWGDGPPVVTANMIRYSMDSGGWANSTGPDNVGRAEGAMVFVPVGDAGMLVYFGGVRDLENNGSATGQPLDEVFLYDVISDKWYSQEASGSIPENRRRFCAGVTWAADQSSYNIYVYGGAVPPDEEGAGLDDLYILSLPSFTWIKMYPDQNTTGDYPHHSLSCNMAAGHAQMIIIGGTFPLTQDCDVPNQWGTHNADLGRQNKDASPWALFEPDKTTYVVPSDVISEIGGNGEGGATKTAPDNGFGHNDLKVLMTRTADIAVRTPTRDVRHDNGPGRSENKPFSTGAIVGIAIGGFVGIVALLAGCYMCLRRHRAKQPEMLRYSAPHLYQTSMSEAACTPTQVSRVASTPSSHRQLHWDRSMVIPPVPGPPAELPSDNGAPPGFANSAGLQAYQDRSLDVRGGSGPPWRSTGEFSANEAAKDAETNYTHTAPQATTAAASSGSPHSHHTQGVLSVVATSTSTSASAHCDPTNRAQPQTEKGLSPGASPSVDERSKSPQELGAEADRHDNDCGLRHDTYYHR